MRMDLFFVAKMAASAVLMSVLAPAHADTVRVLAVGQSNMEGRFGPASHYYQYPSIPEIRSWDYVEDRWEQAHLGERPFSMNDTGDKPANNASYVFAQRVRDEFGDNVDVTLLASGGKRIEYFLPNYLLNRHGWVNTQSSPNFGNSLADEIFGHTGDAKIALPPGEVYDVVLFLQGEANFNRNQVPVESAAEYAHKMTVFVDELWNRDYIDESSVVIFSNINPKYEYAHIHREALQMVISDQIDVIEWRGLLDVGDYRDDGVGNNHATGWGLSDLADRYFQKYLELTGR